MILRGLDPLNPLPTGLELATMPTKPPVTFAIENSNIHSLFCFNRNTSYKILDDLNLLFVQNQMTHFFQFKFIYLFSMENKFNFQIELN